MPDSTVEIPGVGTSTEYRFSIEGWAYQIRYYEPYELLAETPVVEGTPVFTSIDGLNEDSAQRIASDGSRVIEIGPEGHGGFEDGTSLVRKIGLLLTQSQELSARNAHLALNALDDNGVVNTKHIIWTGFSRPGMFGQGVLATQGDHDREVVYACIADPCWPDAPDIRNIHKAPRTVGETVLGSVLGIPEIIRRSRDSETSLWSTVNLDPLALTADLLKVPHLISGQAGSFAAEVPPEQMGTLFSHYLGGREHGRVWREKYEGHPNFEVKDRPLGHSAGAGIDPIEETRARLRIVQQAEISLGVYDWDLVRFASTASREQLGLTESTSPETLEPGQLVLLKSQ